MGRFEPAAKITEIQEVFDINGATDKFYLCISADCTTIKSKYVLLNVNWHYRRFYSIVLRETTLKTGLLFDVFCNVIFPKE